MRHSLLRARGALLIFALLLFSAGASAAPVTLRWDYATSGAAGFMLYCGPASRSYSTKVNVGNVDTYTISTLPEGAVSFCAVTAYDPAKVESPHSNEVSFTVGHAAPAVNFTVTPTSGNAPLTVTFNNTTTGQVQGWSWSFGDGATSTQKSPTHSYTKAGSYKPTLTATGPGGTVTKTAATAITVGTTPAPPPAGTTTTMILRQGLGGYLGTSDVTLNSIYPTRNYGNAYSVKLDGTKFGVLMRFAVFAREGGPIPNNARIQSAHLEIYKREREHTYRLHPMLKAWEESQATWRQARSGLSWTTPGAASVGQDYSTTYDAQVVAPYAPGWMRFDVTRRVQQYAAGSSNFGWKLVPVSGYTGLRYFSASEYLNTSARPRLIVTYTMP
jgi:PKD repeat protein